MNHKHTPGDWMAFEAGVNLPGTDGGHEVHTKVDGQLIRIAECCEGYFTEHYLDTGLNAPDYHLTNDEAFANACLIAAAPDLLAALELLVTTCDFGEIRGVSFCLEISKLAIRKAWGIS